jgi:carbohydrate-selective porin OprB
VSGNGRLIYGNEKYGVQTKIIGGKLRGRYGDFIIMAVHVALQALIAKKNAEFTVKLW